MNVLESRAGWPLRWRPWVLLGAAVVVLAAVLFLTNGSDAPGHVGSTSASSDSPLALWFLALGCERRALTLRTTTPVTGAQDVAPNTTISVTFSSSVSTHTVTPVLTPAVGGKWVRTNATTLSYQLASPLVPSSHEVLTIPGGSDGVRGSNGATLPKSESVSFVVATGDVLRLQQLLAQLDFLPVAFVPSGTAAHHGRPRPGPAGDLHVALAQPARRAHVPMDGGHREHDHQGRGRGLRDPERPRGGRDRGAGRYGPLSSTTPSTTRWTPPRTCTSS